MKSQTTTFILLILLLLVACTTAQSDGQAASQDTGLIVKVFRPPT